MNRLLLCLMLVSVPALAQRLTVLDFSGPGGASARSQLVSALCDTADCVPANKTTTKNRPDWKKARRERVGLFVGGVVKKARKKVTLDLSVFAKAGAPATVKRFTLTRGVLSARDIAAAAELIGKFTEADDAPPPPPPPPPPVDVTKTRDPEKKVAPEPEKKTTPEPEKKPEPEVLAPRTPRRASSAPFLIVELGSDLLNRQLDYVQASTPNLRRYDLALFPLPALRAELYPFKDGGLAGLGFEGGFGMAPFLKSRRQNAAEAYPTTALRVDVGARYRLMPVKDSGLAISPYALLRVQSFSVGPASDGSTLDGLPGINFVGARLGAAVDLPLMDGFLTVLVRGSVIPIFASGEIISARYFTAGSALGFDGSAGVALRLASFLSLRATVEYTQYNLTFRTQPTDTYVAQGASDRYLGGNVAARLSF